MAVVIPGIPLAASAQVAAAANNQTLAASAAGLTTYISSFMVTGGGATAASVILVTVTGLAVGTLNFNIPIPAGVTLGILPFYIEFNPPLPATAPNTAIVLNVPSFGAGNTAASAAVFGFQQ